ncbi:MAG: methyltransferase domain-containing protein [Betaproteobacteria bacterium]|nr:methyltransferase domain-containing protein [Betaproteobacteria bacterium]
MQLQHEQLAPSAWVCRFARLIVAGGTVLDLACGHGRHARYLAGLGYRVEALDRDSAALATLDGVAGISTRCADLEGSPWPYEAGRFDGIVVTNYLHHPLVAALLDALRPGGVFIYETFAVGNEKLGRPSNPEFLLRPDELLQWVEGRFNVLAFEQGLVVRPRPAVLQRICAVRRSVEDCRLDLSP